MDYRNEKPPQRNNPSDLMVVPGSVSGSHLPSTEVRTPIPQVERSLEMGDYINIIFRHKWVILTFLSFVLVTTLIVSLLTTPEYRAYGRLEMNVNAPKVTKFEEVVDTKLQTREFMRTQVNLLQSSSLIVRVINALNLDKNALFNPDIAKPESKIGKLLSNLRAKLKEWKQLITGQKSDTFQKKLEREEFLEKKYKENLSIDLERDTTIINLAFTSPDPILAHKIVNSQIKEFIGWQMDKKIAAADSAKEQLKKQIENARVQLEKSEDELNNFAQRAGIVSLDSKLNLVYRQLEEINNALAKAEADRLAKEALYQQAKAGDVSSIPMVLENPLIQNLREEYIKRLSEYEEHSTVFKADYPRQQKLKAKIADIQKLIAKEENKILNGIQSDYLTSLKTEETLREKAEEKKTAALALNSRATQYKILEREVSTNKVIYQSLLERSKEIDANVGVDIGNMQVVDYAKIPSRPYKPNVRLNLLIALAIGLIGGVGLAFFFEYFDKTVKRVDEISERFQIPVLGVTPQIQEKNLNFDKLVRQDPTSHFSEAIRTTKVSLELSGSGDYPLKSLLITSTAPQEGKTTVASNLAITFAETGERVLLIDCDLRRPRLHRTYGDDSHPRKGLSQFLAGTCGIEDVIKKTDIPNLYFISAGLIPPNPVELLASKRMKKALASFTEHFDRVILDGPPAGGFADVLVLGNIVSGTILVCSLGQTHRDALRLFLKGILHVNGYLLGCVINKLSSGFRYGYNYGYSYGYSYNYKSKRASEESKVLLFEEAQQRQNTAA